MSAPDDRARSMLGAEREKRSIGWIGGAVAFWALSAWLVVVGLSSIIPQIFWPAQTGAVALAGCREELRELHHELLAEAADTLKNAGDSSAQPRFDGWLGEYDDRLKRTSAHCTADERTAFDDLVRARHAVSGFMERFAREEAPRLRQLEAELGQDPRAFAP